MRIRQIALSAAFAASIAALPPAAAEAQYYYSPLCNPFPLTWPFCVVGAVGYVVTAPFRAVAPRPYYYGPPPYAPPPYGPPPYGPPAYAPPPYGPPPK
jgi:hypothetical protein